MESDVKVELGEVETKTWGKSKAVTKVQPVKIVYPDGLKIAGNVISRFPHEVYGTESVRFLDFSEFHSCAVYPFGFDPALIRAELEEFTK